MEPHNSDETVDAGASFRAPTDFPPADAPAISASALAARARASMEAEWTHGNRVPAEWYLDRAPAVAAESGSALDVVFLEFVLREEAGDEPDAETFVGRFPALAPDLRRLLALDLALSASSAVADQPGDPPAGKPATIGRYVVVEQLQGGGQGDVFIGVHPGLGREVVIKRLRRKLAADADRLTAEGRVLAALEHPNLAKVYDLGVDGDRAFLVMESIRGRNLADVRRQSPVDPASAAKWVAATARAADHAHTRGVLHLDIKPRNIVLDDTGRAVLIDFGLARVDRALEPSEAQPGVSGTLAYMAPEQARGEHDRVGPAADVYGLGGVLYYLLVGKDPIAGKSASEMFAQARAGEWDRAALRACGARPALLRVCEQALDPDPTKRFPSATAFAAAVESAVRPRRWPAVAGALAALAVFVGIGFVVWGGPKNSGNGSEAPADPARGAPGAVPEKKPDLRLALGVHKKGQFQWDFPADLAIGDQARVTATVPAQHHAALFLIEESGAVQTLATVTPRPQEEQFVYPASGAPGSIATMKFKAPAGTHVLLFAVSPFAPVSAGQLDLKPTQKWPALPVTRALRVTNGRAQAVAMDPKLAEVIELLNGKSRPVEPGGAVSDPVEETKARLEAVLRSTPKDAAVEALAFVVRPR